MVLSWKRLKEARRARKGAKLDEESIDKELVVPNHFRCPITLELMKDPVTLSTGITYDRESIETWLESGRRTCPVSNCPLESLEPIPNHMIRKMIQNWCVEHRSSGIERIPTPRIPVTAAMVSKMLSGIIMASNQGESAQCGELVVKIKALEKESERNRQCIMANGTTRVLSMAFEIFASNVDRNAVVLKEILSALIGLFPLYEDAALHLGSKESLRCMVHLLMTDQDLASRRNAVLVLKELLDFDIFGEKTMALASIEGSCEGLVKLIKDPICPTTTKTSLAVLFHLVSCSSAGDTGPKLARMGLVAVLLELLAVSDRGICERALGVLDGICSCEAGRNKAYGHALTVPILVKKMMRVSEAATEFAVSALWRLSKNEVGREGGVLDEAVQVGGFQKLLLVLQVGCGEATKEKATELLKLLNLQKHRLLECANSVNFKYIKRSS